MAEHRARIEVGAPVDEVYAFLASPLNLPRWQPMLREAFREGDNRIRVIGKGTGATAEHVRFVTDPPAHHLCWSAESGVGCAGEIWVRQEGGGAAVEMLLRLSNRSERPEALRVWTGDPELRLEEALRAALLAVKSACEGPQTVPDPQTRQALRDSRVFGDTATMRGIGSDRLDVAEGRDVDKEPGDR
jgi:hypothetical protein